MTRYRMADNTIVNTEKAAETWHEAVLFDGRNHISQATGDQWEHQRLHRSSKGRFYVECWSDWQGSLSCARYIEPIDAACWLLTNGKTLPNDLKPFAEQIEE